MPKPRERSEFSAMALMTSFPEGRLEVLEGFKQGLGVGRSLKMNLSPAHFGLRDGFSMDRSKANDLSHIAIVSAMDMD